MFNHVIWTRCEKRVIFIKHFFGRSANAHGSDYAQDIYYGGYCNVTAAIDAVQFKFSSGNIDSGVIKLYGIA